MPLSGPDKKLLQQITAFPWPERVTPPLASPLQAASDEELAALLRGYAPLEDMLLAAVEQFRRFAPQQVANAAWTHPAVPEEARFNWLADISLDLDNHGTAAVARRFLLDDPEELVRFGAVGTRMQWVTCGRGGEGCAYMWTAVLHALSLGDGLALGRLLDTLPSKLEPEDAYPFSRQTPGLYNAVLNLVRGDPDSARRWVRDLRALRLPRDDAAIVTCLHGILDASPELVAEGLEARCASVRRIRTLDPHFKLFDEIVHSLYRLAERIDPGLTRLWDTGHRLPWDAEYHQRLQAGGDPMRTVDLSGLPERQRVLLSELPVPDWWSVVS